MKKSLAIPLNYHPKKNAQCTGQWQFLPYLKNELRSLVQSWVSSAGLVSSRGISWSLHSQSSKPKLAEQRRHLKEPDQVWRLKYISWPGPKLKACIFSTTQHPSQKALTCQVTPSNWMTQQVEPLMKSRFWPVSERSVTILQIFLHVTLIDKQR